MINFQVLLPLKKHSLAKAELSQILSVKTRPIWATPYTFFYGSPTWSLLCYYTVIFIRWYISLYMCFDSKAIDSSQLTVFWHVFCTTWGRFSLYKSKLKGNRYVLRDLGLNQSRDWSLPRSWSLLLSMRACTRAHPPSILTKRDQSFVFFVILQSLTGIEDENSPYIILQSLTGIEK